MNHLSVEDRLELLVADLLSPSEESALLQEIDGNQRHFRTLSMLFLEDRRWKESFAEDLPMKKVQIASHADRETSIWKSRVWKSKSAIGVLAAACLVSSFLLGHRLQPNPTESTRSTTAMLEPTVVSGGSRNDDAISVDSLNSDDVVLGIAEWESRFGHQASPLFDLDATIPNEQFVAAAPDPVLNIPSAVQRDLRRAGWSIEQTVTQVRIRLVGGQRLSLPLTDYQYRFVGRDIY